MRAQRGDLGVERARDPARDDRARAAAIIARQVRLARRGGPASGPKWSRAAGVARSRSRLPIALSSDEIGRDHAHRGVVADPLDLLFDIAAELVEPRQIGLGILGGAHRMLGVEEIGRVVIGAAQLADDIGRRAAAAGAAVAKAVAFGGERPAELGDVVIELAGAGEAVAAEGAQLAVARDRLGAVPIGLGERIVAELGAERRQIADVEAEIGGEGRVVAQILVEPALQHQVKRLLALGRALARRGGAAGEGDEAQSSGTGEEGAAIDHLDPPVDESA